MNFDNKEGSFEKEILSKYACNSPFKYIDVQPLGNFVCCPFWNKTNLRVNKTGEPNPWFAVDEDEDLLRNWTSPQAKKVRRDILDGSYESCDKVVCPCLSQILSKSQIEGKEIIPYNFQLKEDLMKELNINSIEDIENFDTTPEEILFGFDRSCNYRCPSCRTHLIPNDDVNSIEYKRKKIIIDKIDEQYSWNLRKIIITGSGDPFYSKIFRDYLINFNPEKYPKLQEIQLVTNGSLLTPEMWNKIPNVHQYIKCIEISIDAATKLTYETKTRLGGIWETLIQNLLFLSKLESVERVVFSMTVSKHNYKEMYMFWELLKPIFEHKSVLVINYRRIVNWGTYTNDEMKDLQVFDKENPLFNDFMKELKRIHKLPHVDTNFNDLIIEEEKELKQKTTEFKIKKTLI
jgi:sulfatase maturation enzyme AslB (radical SAM superfamily)